MTDQDLNPKSKRSLVRLVADLPTLIVQLIKDEIESFKNELVSKLKHAGIGAGFLVVALFFAFTLQGKALRATAFNRTGARLIGFSPTTAGLTTFTFAAFLGTLSGVLIAPIITVYYDSGFLIGLKGFVAAIVGGLASYPMTAVGAVLVGTLEAFSSFWASGYKEVIVFTLIIPVLLWRSLRTHHVEDDE